MAHQRDLTNVAQTEAYRASREKRIEMAVRPEYKKDEKQYEEQGWRREVTEYARMEDSARYACNANRVFDAAGAPRHEYISTDQHAFFCTPVRFLDGGECLFYKQDLYGYSVLDLGTGKTFDYIPAESFHGGETFIGMDVHYNPQNGLFAVGGCYWACPEDVLLLESADPMRGFERYMDVQDLMGDPYYERYEGGQFQAWEGNDLRMKFYNIQEEPYHNEEVVFREERYRPAMREMKL